MDADRCCDTLPRESSDDAEEENPYGACSIRPPAMLSGIGAAMAAIALGSKRAAAQAPGDAFQPARHQQDEWMTRLTGKHRTIIDCATVSGAGEGMLYASNLYLGNKNGYQLTRATWPLSSA